MGNPRERKMISEIDISNFKCFKETHFSGCKRLNVLVGDSGVGKTAFLEAVFLALSSSPEVAFRYRQQRGIDGMFGGSLPRIEEAIWRNLFHQGNWEAGASIRLTADATDNREVELIKIPSSVQIPFTGGQNVSSGSVAFVYKNSAGQSYNRVPKMGQGGLVVDGIEEDLPDHFYFSASFPPGSVENAQRFSDLSKVNAITRFVEHIKKQFDWIEDIKVEVEAGSPVIHVRPTASANSHAIGQVSAGLNKVVSILLAIASRPRSTVLIDEIENGVFYKHQSSLWSLLLDYADEFNSQIFVTTHSAECLNALSEIIGERDSELTVFRFERGLDHTPTVYQFDGSEIVEALKLGGEVRGGGAKE